jgi:cell division protein FtsI/penicillin-binding protein 2
VIQRDAFRSESGFKPLGAFVVVACVLIAVATRVAGVSLADVDKRSPLAVTEGQEPAFELVDAGGRTVATFVDRMDLVGSPRSMWLAHTPDHMAAEIAAMAGNRTADDVLAALLPDVGDRGWIEVQGLDLSARQASAVLAWAERGGSFGAEEPQRPLAGIDVVPLERGEPAGLADHGPRFRIRWQPAVVLSRAERVAHGDPRRPGDDPGPSRWTRRLLDGLSLAIFVPGVAAQDALDFDSAANAECRRLLWERMMPTAHCIAVRGVPAERATGVERMLRQEGVSPLQMKLVRARDRRYPTGALEIFGSWGRIAGDEPEPLPRAGLELLADRVFADPLLGLHAAEPEAYAFLVHRNRKQGRTHYFLERREAEAPPRVHTTLDMNLLRAVRRELVGVMAEHEPAVAMAIVIDLESGDVLAVDSQERYPIQPFAPVYYAFTPGSTFKLLTMAVALENGKVSPRERIDVGNGHEYRLPDSRRTIREAEGSRSGSITAAECLAFSVNIGMVKIGQRVDSRLFGDMLRALGYGRAPDVGLGPESAGMLPPLPWKENWAHASVCFGHEVMTTLWQHAAGLAAIVRGGTWRPLRLIDAVEQDGQLVELPLAAGDRVFSADTCATIREMMAMGAAIGTGRRVQRPDIVMGTKTGTAEKVATEVCAHVAGAARAAAEAAGRPFSGADYAALKGAPKPHARRTCYTSSMCVVGRSAEAGADGREILVLLVVDEPTGRAKFGSDVAGPAAVRILAEALGRTRDGAATTPVTAAGFALAPDADDDEAAGGVELGAIDALRRAAAGAEPWRAW